MYKTKSNFDSIIRRRLLLSIITICWNIHLSISSHEIITTTTTNALQQQQKRLSLKTIGSTTTSPASLNSGSKDKEKEKHNRIGLEQEITIALSKIDWFDTRQPWVLVPNGNFLGKFDRIPKVFRIGPWSIVISMYLVGLVVLFLLGGIYYCNYKDIQQQQQQQHQQQQQQQQTVPEEENYYFFPAFTLPWYYNSFVFLWMFYETIHFINHFGWGYYIFSTYTVQSWVLLLLRHGLCAFLPFLQKVAVMSLPSSSSSSISRRRTIVQCLGEFNESIRFACLAQATVTFIGWNCLLCPIIVLFGTTDPQERWKFIKGLVLNFHMVQVHGFNIIFATINGIFGSPKRNLILWTDGYIAFALCVLYLLFYTLILDRLGIHLYCHYSPRTLLPLLTYTGTLALYWISFVIWKKLIQMFGIGICSNKREAIQPFMYSDWIQKKNDT